MERQAIMTEQVFYHEHVFDVKILGSLRRHRTDGARHPLPDDDR
jgi:hypothetical protein